MKAIHLAAGGLFLAATALAGGLVRLDQPTIDAMSNLRSIGMGVMMYANENRGYTPKDFGQIVSFIKKPEVFLDPRLKTAPPADWDQLSPAEKADWANAHCEFVFTDIAGTKMSKVKQAATAAMAHTKAIAGQKQVILYLDGHAEVKDPPATQP